MCGVCLWGVCVHVCVGGVACVCVCVCNGVCGVCVWCVWRVCVHVVCVHVWCVWCVYVCLVCVCVLGGYLEQGDAESSVDFECSIHLFSRTRSL